MTGATFDGGTTLLEAASILKLAGGISGSGICLMRTIMSKSASKVIIERLVNDLSNLSPRRVVGQMLKPGDGDPFQRDEISHNLSVAVRQVLTDDIFNHCSLTGAKFQ